MQGSRSTWKTLKKKKTVNLGEAWNFVIFKKKILENENWKNFLLLFLGLKQCRRTLLVTAGISSLIWSVDERVIFFVQIQLNKFADFASKQLLKLEKIPGETSEKSRNFFTLEEWETC